MMMMIDDDDAVRISAEITESTDVSRGFSQCFLEISPGHLLLHHAGFTLGELPPNLL